MINVLRKNQKALWIVIALLCIPFVFYFSKSNLGEIRNTDVGRIYDKPVTQVEFRRNARLFQLARNLGMYNLLQTLVAGAQTENDAAVEFVWNRLILRHEAERLGITSSTTEVANVVKGLMPFRGKNGFDRDKYDEFVKNYLPTLGFTDAQIEELAEDQLALARLKDLVGTGVQVPASESNENYERAYGKLSVTVFRLRSADLAKDVQINDDDIAKYFQAHQAELNTEEKRKVGVVTFALTDEQKKLTGKERVDALQKLSDRANDFNQALLEKGAEFDQVAAKFQLPVQVTGEFTLAKPDPILSANPQLAASAFQLTPQEPNSDATQMADSFLILHLNGIDPAKPLTLEEARPKVVEALKDQRVQQLVSTKGAELAHKIREAVKSGTPLEAALQQAGVPAEKIPPFSLVDNTPPKPEPGKEPQPEAADLPMIKRAVAEMTPGDVSEVVPTESGGLVAILEKREQPAPATGAGAREQFDIQFLQGKREVAFYEWMRERRRDAGIQTAAGAQRGDEQS